MDGFVLAIGLGLASFACLQFARHRARVADRKHLQQLLEQTQRRFEKVS